MRVVLVSGSWPPEHCGVGDYTNMLAGGLEERGIHVERFDTSGKKIRTIMKTIRALNPQIIHLQYPTAGYGRSFIPSLIPILLSKSAHIVITLHEFSIFGIYRWPWFAPFTRVDALVFTRESERLAFKRSLRIMPRLVDVINIGSSIPAAPLSQRLPFTLCYFGLIMPEKGLEDFLELAKLLAGTDFKVHLIAAATAKHRRYAELIFSRAAGLGIEMHIGQPPLDVAVLLQKTWYAYLPYPDGASERRSSLLAALINGVQVLTTYTSKTPEFLKNATIEVSSPRLAAEYLTSITAGSAPDPQCDQNANLVAAHFGWPQIADAHVRLYRQILCSDRDLTFSMNLFSETRKTS